MEKFRPLGNEIIDRFVTKNTAIGISVIAFLGLAGGVAYNLIDQPEVFTAIFQGENLTGALMNLGISILLRTAQIQATGLLFLGFYETFCLADLLVDKLIQDPTASE